MRGQKLPFADDEALRASGRSASGRGGVTFRELAREGTLFRELARETNGLEGQQPVGPGQGAGKLIAQQIADGNLDGLFTLLSKSQLSHLARSSHPPLYALTRLRHAVETALAASATVDESKGGGGLSGGLSGGGLYPHPHMLSHQFFLITEGFLGALTGCERILRTPLPPGYVGVLRIFMLVFLGVLPFSLLGTGLEWGLIPICSLLSYLLLEVEETAVQMEQPFGFEYNDLPIDAYCLGIQADALRLLDESRLQAERVGGSQAPAPSRRGVTLRGLPSVVLDPRMRWSEEEAFKGQTPERLPADDHSPPARLGDAERRISDAIPAYLAKAKAPTSSLPPNPPDRHASDVARGKDVAFLSDVAQPMSASGQPPTPAKKTALPALPPRRTSPGRQVDLLPPSASHCGPVPHYGKPAPASGVVQRLLRSPSLGRVERAAIAPTATPTVAPTAVAPTVSPSGMRRHVESVWVDDPQIAAAAPAAPAAPAPRAAEPTPNDNLIVALADLSAKVASLSSMNDDDEDANEDEETRRAEEQARRARTREVLATANALQRSRSLTAPEGRKSSRRRKSSQGSTSRPGSHVGSCEYSLGSRGGDSRSSSAARSRHGHSSSPRATPTMSHADSIRLATPTSKMYATFNLTDSSPGMNPGPSASAPRPSSPRKGSSRTVMDL